MENMEAPICRRVNKVIWDALFSIEYTSGQNKEIGPQDNGTNTVQKNWITLNADHKSLCSLCSSSLYYRNYGI